MVIGNYEMRFELKKNTKQFVNVCFGEVFMYMDVRYIKFQQTNGLNALNLTTHKLEFLDSEERVYPIDGYFQEI